MSGHESPKARFALHLLGHVDLRGPDGAPLEGVLAQPKRFALLAYLRLAGPGAFHRRDTLLALFWPELDRARARAALRQALHFLRQALGGDVIISRGTEDVGIASSAVRCDTEEYDRALSNDDRAHAVRIYHGGFLNGVHVSDAPDFERWVDRQRDRYARAYVEALETLATECHACGDLASAAEYLRALIAHEPYLAAPTVKLMEILAASGDRAGALTQARTHSERVVRDLELDPDPSVFDCAERLRRRAKPPARQDENALSDTISAGDADPAARSGARQRARAHRWSLIAAMLLVVAVPIVWITTSHPQAAATEDARTSVGVMPMESPMDAGSDYLAQGVGRAVVRALRDLRQIRVLGPEDTRGLVSDEGFGRRAIEEQNVHYVLRSEIVPHPPNGHRLIPALIRIGQRDTVWSDTLTVTRGSLTTIHGHIAAQVANAIGLTLLPAEQRRLATPVTADSLAYELYLRGNQRLRHAVTRGDDLLAAVDRLEQAVARDTSFALAYSQLAIANLSLYWWQRDRTPERLAAAKTAADAVMRLRPDLPEAHLAMGWYHYWGRLDYERALSHFEMARATRSPNSDLMILLAAMRRRQGDWAGSTTLYEDALADNPTCAWCAMDLGFSWTVLGQYARAEIALRQAVLLSPDFFYGQVFGALLEIVWRGDTTRARAWIDLDEYDANEIVQTGTRHWAVLGRVLGPAYDEVLARTRLTEAVDDTADYYLGKAQLFTQRRQRARATAYFDSASVWLERHVAAREGDARTHALLGLAYAGQGRADEAVAAGTLATELLPPTRDAMDGPLWMLRLAEIHVMIGRFDAAVDLLEQVVAMPSWVTPALLRVDPVWQPLWGMERFERLASSP
jgi:serine/threonine-protein kinase